MERKQYTKEDFSWTSWTPSDIRARVPEILAKKRAHYDEIKKISATDRTFENTIAAIEATGGDVSPIINYIDVLMNMSPLADVRNAAKEAVDLFSREIIDIEYDEGIYQAVKEYVARKENLEGPRKKLLDDMIREYRRMGFDLSAEDRLRLKENSKKLAEITIQFGKNINDWQDFILVTREELEGLPEAYINGLSKDGEERYKVTLEYPDLNPFMENAVNEEKRRELWGKYLQKGGQVNMQLLVEMVCLRDENAKLLGYKNHVDFKTDPRMAKNAKTVEDFVLSLLQSLTSFTKKDLEALRDVKREMTKNPTAEIEDHDVRFYINQHKKRTLRIDSEVLREYFPLKCVISGMFEIYSKLFSVQFKKCDGYSLWHPDVDLYRVSNLDDSLVAYIIFDLHPREGKYRHAAEFPTIQGHLLRDGGYRAPLATLVTNFPKNTSEKPSLLSHDEVETLFHEFGHAVHEVLTETEYMSQAGTSVARDFVEAPSQMLENWMWQPETINMVSGHYTDTSKKIPDEMMRQLIRSKNHMIAHWSTRQLIFALFDYTIHSAPSGLVDIKKTYDDLVKKYMGFEMAKENIFPAGFGHMASYDAGYYGYMWSLVYAADMFTRFATEGILNPVTGKEYREKILAKGSSFEDLELVKSFLGREPNNKAFLKDIGLGE